MFNRMSASSGNLNVPPTNYSSFVSSISRQTRLHQNSGSLAKQRSLNQIETQDSSRLGHPKTLQEH